MNKTTKTLLTAAITGLAITSAQAALIAVSDVTASSEIPGTAFIDRLDDYLIDGSGISGGVQNTTQPNDNMWLSAGSGFGGVDSDPNVVFDLGALYTINSIQVWNYNENNLTNRGVNAVTVRYGTDGVTFGGTVAGITSFTESNDTTSDPGDLFNAFTPFNARYIKFDIDSNYGDGNSFYGLGEVQFDGVPVPEPGSLALMGLGGLLIARRRRG